MSRTLRRWFAYGFGAAVGRALFDERADAAASKPPVRTGTEADFRADEKRFAEDEKRIEAETKRPTRR